MKGKKISALLKLPVLFTVFIIATSMRYTRCLDEFMPLSEAKRILLSKREEDIYKKDSHFVHKKYEKQWKAVDDGIRVLVRGDIISVTGYGIATSSYTYSSDFEVNLSNGATTRGVLRVEDLEFRVVYEDNIYRIEYDKGYIKNEEMEQALGISTEQVVNEVRSTKENFFEMLNKVAYNEWEHIRQKAIRNISIGTILWFMTLLQYIYRYRKNKN